MKASPYTLAVSALTLALSLSAAQAAQREIGSTVTVVNMVTAEFNRDVRTLQEGDRVAQYETIDVGLDASSELKLDDDTKLALGPGSNLTLDKFVYDPDKPTGSIIVNLLKGTFRFMTGVAEKPSYTIKTPAAAITVRGTIFDVFIQTDGTEWLLLHEGAVRVCNAKGQCRDHAEPGKLIRIDDQGNVGAPVKWASLPGKDAVPFDKAFPFVVKSPTIDPKPALTRDAIILGNLPSPGKPDTYDKPSDDKPTYEEPQDDKPRKKAERKSTPTYEKSYEKKVKKQKTAKKGSDDDYSGGSKGPGLGIGLGIGFGFGGGHKPGGYGGGMGGGMGGGYGKGMGGGGGYGK
jgi:hypothetical protein